MNDDFGVTKVVTSSLQTRNKKPRKIFENVELQALLDKDDSQIQKQLAEQLGVSQKAVSNRLQPMGKIQKTGRWVQHKLNDKQMEKRRSIFIILPNLTCFLRKKSAFHTCTPGK